MCIPSISDASFGAAGWIRETILQRFLILGNPHVVCWSCCDSWLLYERCPFAGDQHGSIGAPLLLGTVWHRDGLVFHLILSWFLHRLGFYDVAVWLQASMVTVLWTTSVERYSTSRSPVIPVTHPLGFPRCSLPISQMRTRYHGGTFIVLKIPSPRLRGNPRNQKVGQK